MKTITGTQAINLLTVATAVIIMDEWHAVVYPSIEADDEKYASIYMTYETEGMEYEYNFEIYADDTIEIRDNCLMLTDADNKNELVGIQILEPKEISNT